MARASLIVSYAESATQQTTSVTGASVTTFDNLPTGVNNNVPLLLNGSTVGTYDHVTVSTANQFGGSNGTKFITVSGSNAQTTLTLAHAVAYFGLWWSAGDPANVLSFYSGSDLVAQFTTATALNTLPNEYFGNPTPQFLDQDSKEAFAYLNFYGADGTTWDSVVLSNNASSGFESDNHAVRTEAWDVTTEGAYPGVVFASVSGTQTETVVTPEPGSLVLAGLGMLVVAVGPLRNRR